MPSAQPSSRPKHRPALGAWPLLVAMLLAVLQAATPFAHAMLHVAASAQASAAHAGQAGDAGWSGTAAEEKPCALCAADHLPALPEAASATTPIATAQAPARALPVSARSSAPLDLFCRPPPLA